MAAVSALEFGYRPPRSPYGKAILESRPAGYWDLGEFRGPDVHDAVAGNPPGQFYGAFGFGTNTAIASSPDTGVQLDGTGGAIVLGTPVAEARPLSLAFWIRPDEGAALAASTSSWRPPAEGPTALLPWLVASQTTGASTWTMTFAVPNRLSVVYGTPVEPHAVRVSGRVEAGRFSFVVLTLGRKGVRLWIDGRLASLRPRRVPPALLGFPSPLTFGGAPRRGLRGFVGTVDDIAAFPRPLRSDEIRRLWRVARGGAPA